MKKIILLIFVIGLISCDKINPKSVFFGEWIIIKKEKQNTDGSWENITKPCEEDDAEAYRNMGIWYYYPGNIRCQSTDEIVQGMWNYDKTDNRIVYTNSSYINVSEAYVDLITKDSMTLSIDQGDTSKIRIFYAKAK